MVHSVTDRALSHALVRPPGPSFVHAISTNHAAIDVELAQRQHAEYCQALAGAGLQVEALPPDPGHPDSCFMQDPALVVAGQAIVCRMGAPSRQGEEQGAAEALARRGFALERIKAPGTLEGGDVLLLPRQILVGETPRSNPAGIRQFAEILAPLGLPVASVPVRSYLHLLSAVTYLGHNVLLSLPEFATYPAFAGLDVVVVSPEDGYAVNSLGVGSTAIVPAGHPRVGQALVARGFNVLPVPTSEFAKADGGVTCLSLVW